MCRIVKKRYQNPLLLLLVFFIGFFMKPVAADTYTMGVIPQQPPARIVRTWAPLVGMLADSTGLKIRLVTAPNIDTFLKRAEEGAYDFGYYSPNGFVSAKTYERYIALARQTKTLNGIIVAQVDGPYANFDALEGARIAFPSVKALSASIVPRAELKLAGKSFTPSFVGSHDSVYLAIARGIVDAGGGVERTFNAMPKKIRDQLKIIYRTKQYTPHPIVAARRLPLDVRTKFVRSLLELQSTEDGAAVLRSLGIENIIEATSADWNDVRALMQQSALFAVGSSVGASQ